MINTTLFLPTRVRNKKKLLEIIVICSQLLRYDYTVPLLKHGHREENRLIPRERKAFHTYYNSSRVLPGTHIP